jgi:hypothetical protein
MELLYALFSTCPVLMLTIMQSVWRTNIWVMQINIGESILWTLDHPLTFSRVTREIPLPYQFDRPDLSDGEDEDGETQHRRRPRRRAAPVRLSAIDRENQ